jgi:GNAT superfamily N-acetyltransferase
MRFFIVKINKNTTKRSGGQFTRPVRHATQAQTLCLGKQMEIREIKPSELNKLLELYCYLHDADDPLPDEDAVNKIWQQIQDNKQHIILGAFENDNLVSSCVINIIPNLTRGCRPYALIENVITHPEHRRQGFAKALMNQAIDYAREQGCYKVMLLTGRKSESVYNFYESVGFNGNEKQAFIIKIEKS